MDCISLHGQRGLVHVRFLRFAYFPHGARNAILRIQFTLLTLLVAIVTLQIPMLLFFSMDSNLGKSLSAAFLLLWLLGFAASVKIRPADPYESSEGGRWKKIEPE